MNYLNWFLTAATGPSISPSDYGINLDVDTAGIGGGASDLIPETVNGHAIQIYFYFSD